MRGKSKDGALWGLQMSYFRCSIYKYNSKVFLLGITDQRSDKGIIFYTSLSFQNKFGRVLL